MASAGDIVLASDYNSIYTTLYTLMGTTSTGYGATLSSSPVVQGQEISHVEWNNLYNDVQRATIHQLGANSQIFGNPEYVVAGELVTANNVNLLTSAINSLYTYRSTVYADQLTTTATNAVSIRTTETSWIAEIEHDISYNWTDELHFDYFLNLGGYLTPRLLHDVSISGNDTTSTSWANLMNTFNANAYRLAGTSELITVTNLNKSITLKYVKSASSATFQVALADATSNEYVDMNITSVVSLIYSNDNTGGILAPLPQVNPTKLLSSQGNYALLTSQPSPVPQITFFAGSSGSQNIRISNIGTLAAVISDIIMTADVVDGLIYYTSAQLPLTIPAGGYQDITVTYGGSPVTNVVHKGALRLISNNGWGDYVIPTTFLAKFTASINPISYTQTVTTVDKVYIDYTISTVGGTFAYGIISQPGTPGFTIPVRTNSNTFRITFDPTNRLNGTNATSFTVQVYSQGGQSATVAAGISLNLDIHDYHLGSWVSALGIYDSVVGFSYDIIGGKRCLSFGVGTGYEDADLNNGGQLQVSAAMTMLGPNVATTPASPAVYPYQNSSYGSFLNSYGIWKNPNGGPDGYYTWDTTGNPYSFNVPHTSGNVTYHYQFSSDNDGYFFIDGSQVDYSNNYSNPTVGTISLSPGTHNVSWNVVNNSGPGSMALRIYDDAGTDVWTTLSLIDHVYYWLDFGRIYLDGTARTYYSKDYAFRNYWCGYFGTGNAVGSMFSITDNGNGDLNIGLNNLRQYFGDTGADITLTNLNSSFYYYMPNISNLVRYHNLEGPLENGLTHYLTGFTNAGVVTTSLVSYPKPPPTVVVGTRGGGNRVITVPGYIDRPEPGFENWSVVPVANDCNTALTDGKESQQEGQCNNPNAAAGLSTTPATTNTTKSTGGGDD